MASLADALIGTTHSFLTLSLSARQRMTERVRSTSFERSLRMAEIRRHVRTKNGRQVRQGARSLVDSYRKASSDGLATRLWAAAGTLPSLTVNQTCWRL